VSHREGRLLETVRRAIEEQLDIELTDTQQTVLDSRLLKALTQPDCSVFDIRNVQRRRSRISGNRLP